MPHLSRPAWRGASRLAVGAMICLLAVQWVHAVTGIGGAGAAAFFGRWTYDAIVILAGVSLLMRGAGARSTRGTWLLLGVGLLSKAVGDVIYSLAGNLAAVPVPSASDPFWLAVYPCAYLALLLLVRDRVRTALAATRLDGVICGVTAAAALACVTLPAAFSADAGASFWEQATDLAYPVGDLILIGAVVSAVALSGWRVDRTLGTLGLAILAWEAADLMYMFSVTGTAGAIADALVLTGVAGAAVAATRDRPTTAYGDGGERGLFVPVAFGAVALVILIGGAALRLEIPGLCLAALALALVLIRMKLALSENRALLHTSTAQARTDPLTGLDNRRQLTRDLARVTAETERTGEIRTLAVVMLDLNGFKAYNDTFGHAAGDALLVQLASSLTAALHGRGDVYRLGGDEFCVLAPCDEHETGHLSALCHDALATRGDGFSISAAHGVALIPTEARDASDALALADARMYADKAGTRHPHVAGELARVLTAVLEERAPALARHGKSVCRLAAETGTTLGLTDAELETLRHAATLHDLGTMAIPDSILAREGPLSASEEQLLHQHPIIGQRILAATPAMQAAAELVRSCHERYDGHGFPDRLHADQIPLGSRIIAVADAYDTVTTSRPEHPALSTDRALAELRRCSGTRFDPRVTAAFERALTLVADATPAS